MTNELKPCIHAELCADGCDLDEISDCEYYSAERTCHPIEKFTEGSPWPVMVCSECGRTLHYDEHREMDYQPYCGCGAKVVSE